MPIFRSVRNIPVILSLGIVILTGFAVSTHVPHVLNASVNHVLRTRFNDSYRVELRGVSGISLQGLDVETILVEATTVTAPVQQVQVSRVRVHFDMLSIFREAGLNGFEQLEIADIAVLFPQGTLDSMVSDRFSHGPQRGSSGDVPDSSRSMPSLPVDRLARIEQQISRVLAAIPAGISGPIAVSVYEAVDEDHPSVFAVPDSTMAPFSAPGILIATADLSVSPGRIETTVAYAAYSVSLHVNTEDTATLSANVWGHGPGAAVAAALDEREITISAELSPPDFQVPQVLPAPDLARAFDSASLSFRMDHSDDATPSSSTAPHASSSPQQADERTIALPATGVTSSIAAFETAFTTLRSIFSDSGTPAPATEPLPAMETTVTIHAVNPARFFPAFGGIPTIPTVTATLHTTEESVNGTAMIDGGALGTLAARDVVLPVSRPRTVSAAKVQLTIPPGVPSPIMVEKLPPQFRALLRNVGMIGAAGDVTLPSLSVVATAKHGTINGTARAEHPAGFTIATEGRVDLMNETVALSSVRSRWNDGSRAVAARASMRATWDEVRSLAAFSPIPAGVVAELEIQFEGDEIAVELNARTAEGRIHIPTLEARFRGQSYALTGAATDGTGNVPRVIAQSSAYQLTQSRIHLAPGAVTLSDMTMTPDGLSGSIDYQDIPVTRILAAFSQPGEDKSDPEGLAAPDFAAPDPDPNRAITTGNLSGQMRFDTHFLRPRLAATLRGEAFTVFGETGSFSVALEQDATSLRVEQGEIDLGNLLTGSFSGRLPLAVSRSGLTFLNLTDSALNASLQSARFDSFFPSDEDELRPKGALTVDVELLEQTGDLRAELDFRVRPETIDGDTPDFSGFGYERLRGTLRVTEDRSDRLKVHFAARADDTEILDATGIARIPGLSQAAPTLVPREITWSLEGSSELPLEYIAPFLPGVVALTGQVSGEMTGAGTLATPTLSGMISIADGELRTVGQTPPISAMNGALRFRDARFFTGQFSAESGLSPFTVSIEGMLPNDGEPGTVTATLRGKNLLIATSPLLRVRADADLSVSGAFKERLSLTGLITVQDGLFSQDIPLIDFDTVPSIDPDMLQLFSVQNPFANRTDLDLRIIADKTFRVENNLYQGAFSSDLRLRGTLEVPRPQGRVFADSGRLILPLTSLRLEQAVLRFPQDRPFTPGLQARGTSRLRDYQLNVAVTGTLPGVEVNVTTTPPLPQGDALVLLSTGFTPQELAESGNRAALAIGSRLGTQFVQSLVGSSGGEAGEDLADRVSVLLGEGVSESGAETIEIEFRLTEEDSWFLVFRRDRYERYNMDLAWRFWLD